MVSARVQGFDEDRTNGTPLQVNDTNQRQASLRASGFVGGGAWQAAGFASSQTYDQSFSAVAPGRASESLTQRQRVPSEAAGGSADWLRVWGRSTLVAGGEGRRVEGTTNETRYVAGRPQPTTRAGGVQTTAAGFAQVTVQAAPQWTVVGGARVDRITTENVVSGTEESHVHPSARGSVTWQATPLWSLRGTAYHAFRAPDAQRALPQLPRRRHADPGQRGADRGEAHRRRDLGAAGPRAVERRAPPTSTPRSTTPSPTSRCR